MKQLLVATTNPGKVAELAPMLAAAGFEPVGLDRFPGLPEAIEDGATFAENALKKARHYSNLTGLAALADDSGLEVAALNGAPGVRSARFAGPQADTNANNALLLSRLEGVSDRRAAFRCCLCLVERGAPAITVSGRCDGTLLTVPSGLGGFGYDPLFVPNDTAAAGRSFAELTREQKAAISHRGRALTALAAELGRELRR